MTTQLSKKAIHFATEKRANNQSHCKSFGHTTIICNSMKHPWHLESWQCTTEGCTIHCSKQTLKAEIQRPLYESVRIGRPDWNNIGKILSANLQIFPSHLIQWNFIMWQGTKTLSTQQRPYRGKQVFKLVYHSSDLNLLKLPFYLQKRKLKEEGLVETSTSSEKHHQT